MSNLEKMRSILQDGKVDALLLTSQVSRLYASGYDVAEGVAVIGKQESFYFTDSRYIEVAENNLKGFTVLVTDRENPTMTRINSALAQLGAMQVGIEEDYLSYC